jgi:hypothetical protein
VKRRSSVALGCLVSEEKAELERFVQADVLKFRTSREGFGEVGAIERAAEARVC